MPTPRGGLDERAPAFTWAEIANLLGEPAGLFTGQAQADARAKVLLQAHGCARFKRDVEVRAIAARDVGTDQQVDILWIIAGIGEAVCDCSTRIQPMERIERGEGEKRDRLSTVV